MYDRRKHGSALWNLLGKVPCNSPALFSCKRAAVRPWSGRSTAARVATIPTLARKVFLKHWNGMLQHLWWVLWWVLWPSSSELMTSCLGCSCAGWRGAAHGRGDGRAAAAEHGLRVPVSPGGSQAVRQRPHPTPLHPTPPTAWLEAAPTHASAGAGKRNELHISTSSSGKLSVEKW